MLRNKYAIFCFLYQLRNSTEEYQSTAVVKTIDLNQFISKPPNVTSLGVPRDGPEISPAVDRTTTHYSLGKGISFEVSEQLLIRDILYCFQGVDGKYITYNPKVPLSWTPVKTHPFI